MHHMYNVFKLCSLDKALVLFLVRATSIIINWPEEHGKKCLITFTITKSRFFLLSKSQRFRQRKIHLKVAVFIFPLKKKFVRRCR